MERKILPLSGLKMLDEGTGGFQAYVSVFGHLDDGGDIVLPGAYSDTIEEFLTRGFTAHSHDWSYDGVIGYPVSAKEDEHGLLCESRFHSTPDAQTVRTKMRERTDAGLGTFTSIGYDVFGVRTLTPDQYDEELPKVLAPEMREEHLRKAKRFAKIRLLPKIKLYEYSVVTVPMLQSAEVTNVKAREGKTMDVFAQWKAQHLGTYAEAEACYAALRDLQMSLMWRCIEPALYNYDGMPMEDRMAALKAGLDEFGTLTLQICEALLPVAEQGMPEGETESAGLKAAEPLSTLSFGVHTAALGTALATYTERASWDREQRKANGRPISHREEVAALAARLKTAGETLETLAALPAEPAKASAEEIEAVIARFNALQAAAGLN